MQQRTLSSLTQQKMPNRSVQRLETRQVSQKRTGKNTVSTIKYSMRMQVIQNMQKLRKASIEEYVPAKNASAFVKDVIVMDGPAWASDCTIRVDAGNLSEV